MKESFRSNWRYDLREVEDDIPSAKKKNNGDTEIKVKDVNNKVVINPPVSQNMESVIKDMGGELLEVSEIGENVSGLALSPQELQTQRKMAMLNVRLAKQRQRSMNKIKDKSVDIGNKEKVKEETIDEVAPNIIKATQDAFNKEYGRPDGRLVPLRYREKVKGKKKESDKKKVKEETINEVSPSLMKAGQDAFDRDYKLPDGRVKPLRGRVKAKKEADKKKESDKKEVTSEEVKDEQGLDKYDRHKRMIRHKQDKYGKNIIGADYNLENERKAKGWKKKLNKEDFVDEAAKDQSSKQLDRGMKTTQKAMGVIDNSPYGELSGDKVDRMNKRLRDRRKDISGEKTSKLTKLLKKEDKAFDNVVSMLRKSHGASGVLTKDSPKSKAQPQPKKKPEKDTRSSAQREVDAQYGRTPWNKRGSLGT